MRTTFFAVALCAATTMAAPRRLHLGNVVNKAENEVSDLESSLGVRNVRKYGKKLVNEVEDEVFDLTNSVGVRSALDTSSVTGTVGEVEDEVTDLTTSVGVDGTLSEVEDEVSNLGLDTSSLGVRAPLDTSDVTDDTAMLDNVVSEVEDILDLDVPSADKLQRILNTIVDEIQTRDAEKRSLSLTHLSLAGLDLSALDTATVDVLLNDLLALVQSLLTDVDPSLASTVHQLIDNIGDTISEVESALGVSNGDLLGLDLDIVNGLDLGSLVDDIEYVVAHIVKAVLKEVKSVDPPLAREIRSLLKEVKSVLSDVEDAAGVSL